MIRTPKIGIARIIYTIPFNFVILAAFSCNKLVNVPNPINSVTANQVFSNDATATSAMLGIYSYLNRTQSFSNYYTTNFLGRSADELKDETAGYEDFDFFLINKLTAYQNSPQLGSLFWKPAYFNIYAANSIISGLQLSTGVSAGTRDQLTGEAKFVRAFCYFYLTNIYGDIPLVLSTDFNQTVLLSRSKRSDIYAQILSDLLDAQNLMVDDFSLSGGKPIRANKWAATALLARVYQYLGQWQSADSAANAVINSGRFQLLGNLDNVFLANSSEAILQLQTASTGNGPFATWEGNEFIPRSNNLLPGGWLSPELLGSFETNDLRRSHWVDSSESGGIWYYYPFKYKVKFTTVDNITENYTILRFAEQYLIRAEAELRLNNLTGAIQDLNTIRNRAGLDSLDGSLTPAQIMDTIQHEYRIEFFAEWGHRWLDLKRWEIAVQTLSAIPYKGSNITDTIQLLYPIPISEIQTDPDLTQNPGY